MLVRSLCAKGIRNLALFSEDTSGAIITAFAEGALLGEWDGDKHKTDPKKDEKQLESFTLLVNAAAGVEAAFERGRIIGTAQNTTRELVNEPANLLNPEKLAAAAQATANQFGLGCRILDQAEMTKLGMGALLGVAQGSDNPPFLIVLSYKPEQAAGTDHLALIGKGVTFDTGGNSIKTSEGMERMKYDMAGAAAVIAAMGCHRPVEALRSRHRLYPDSGKHVERSRDTPRRHRHHACRQNR